MEPRNQAGQLPADMRLNDRDTQHVLLELAGTRSAVSDVVDGDSLAAAQKAWDAAEALAERQFLEWSSQVIQVYLATKGGDG